MLAAGAEEGEMSARPRRSVHLQSGSYALHLVDSGSAGREERRDEGAGMQHEWQNLSSTASAVPTVSLDLTLTWVFFTPSIGRDGLVLGGLLLWSAATQSRVFHVSSSFGGRSYNVAAVVL